MEPPQFGQPQNPDPYAVPLPSGGNDKKTLFLMVGGLVLIVLLLVFVLTRSSGNPSQASLRKAAEHTGNSVGIIDEYLGDIDRDNVKNDLALSLILLRGNQKNLSELYYETFKGAKKLPSKPKPTEEAVESLESAKRNNILDDEIIKLLREEVDTAHSALIDTKPHFTSKSSRQIIQTAEDDLKQVADILDQDR